MKQRYAVAGALAIGLMLASLMVGRARAESPAVEGGEPWTPAVGDTWQYQLQGAIDVSVDADILDVDLFTTPRSVISVLHDRGRRVLCYISAGTWEPYRPDAGAFPADVLGRAVAGWEDERWLDIRRQGVLRPLMRARLDRCAAKGFDGVEFDWIDAHAHRTGFPISRADQLAYDRWLARAAHARGLLVAQKNAPGLVADLVGTFDLAVVEECFQYRECWRYQPYLDAGRPVLVVEYALRPARFCQRAADLGASAIRKRLALGRWRIAC